MRFIPPLLLGLALAACNGSDPQPASAPGPNAASQMASATLGADLLQVRLVHSEDLGSPIARQYGITRSADRWLLLISPRSRQGDAIAVGNLQLAARAGSLVEAPATLKLRPVHTGAFVDFIGEIRSPGPATLRLEIDARRGSDQARLRLVRELAKRGK